MFKLVSTLVRSLPSTSSLTVTPKARLLSVSSSALFRRPLDLDDDHIESMSLREESASSSAPRGEGEMFPSVMEDGRKERSVNTVTLLGRVGMEPVMRGTEESPVTTFSLATNTHWRSGTEWREKTDWHNIVIFKPYLRENAFNNITKGTRLHVTGKLTYGKYVDRNGVERQTTSVVCEDFIFLSKKSSAY